MRVSESGCRDRGLGLGDRRWDWESCSLRPEGLVLGNGRTGAWDLECSFGLGELEDLEPGIGWTGRTGAWDLKEWSFGLGGLVSFLHTPPPPGGTVGPRDGDNTWTPAGGRA